VTTRGKNNINIWLPVIIPILIGQLRNIFKSKRPRSSSVFGCSVNWPDWNVTILFRFYQRCLKWQPKRCFNADGKYVLILLNVVIHEHQFKRKRIYCKFHFDKEAYTKSKIRQDLYVLNWKFAYDVMLFIYQSHEQHFAEF
jgi:hypothetical protein